MSKKETEIIQVGHFIIETGKVRISDPCYDEDTWCAGVVDNVKSGTWQATVIKTNDEDWGERVAKLIAYHKDSISDVEEIETFRENECEFDVGVDSGQAGIFDVKHYKDDNQFKNEKPKADYGSIFYNFCCDATLSDLGAGVIPYGCVSSSGYGDGGYTATKYLNDDGQVVAIAIKFIETEFICDRCGDDITENEYYDNDGLCDSCC